FLFPELRPESGYARLKACMNPQGHERMRFGQIIAAMRFCQSYEPLYFACDETFHGRPPRVAPEDEEVKLVEAINGAADTMKRALAQLERMRERKVIMRVA